MTNDATRATARALPEISDLLRRLIERHDAAAAYFDSVCYLSDRGVLGREPTEDETAVYDAANTIEENTLSEACYFPARTPDELAAKARHLRKYHDSKRGNLQDWQVENLLRSMLPDDERDQIDDSEEAGKGGAA